MSRYRSRLYAALVVGLFVAGIGAIIVARGAATNGRGAVTEETRVATDEEGAVTEEGGPTTDEAAVVPEETGTVADDPEAVSENEADLTLRAEVNNGRPEALVGTSLWVHAWIFNENQQRRAKGLESLETPTVRIGMEDKPWIDFLQFKLVHVGSGDPGERIPEALGNVDWKTLIPEFIRKRTNVRDLGMAAERVSWVIPPKMASRLAPGQYQLTATFDTRTTKHGDIVKVLLTSKPAYFQLRAPANKRERATVILSEASYVASYDRNLEQALALAKSAQELAPQYMEVHNTLGAIYRVQRRWEEALTEYKVYLEYLQAQDLPPSEDGPVDHLQYLIESIQKQLELEEAKGTSDKHSETE